MQLSASILLLGGVLVPSALAINGKSFTGWDCCKPACAWKTNLNNVQGIAKTCDRNNNQLFNTEAKSVCDGNGPGFLCGDYQPQWPSLDRSYGFAVKMSGNQDCCKCYQVQWTSGAAVGKTMIVQAINIGSPTRDVTSNDLVIQVPGGGMGPNTMGCQSQYGNVQNWGDQYGGLVDRSGCERLPGHLQSGCYWRFNWARGDVNRWDIVYNQVQCPQELTRISGCSA